MANTWWYEQLVAVVAATVGTSGVLNGAKMRLYTNVAPPTNQNDLSYFTEPSFTGYAAQTVTWGAAYTDPNGNGRATGSNCEFIATADPSAPTVIQGFFLESSDTTPVLLFSSPLPAPVSITKKYDSVVVAAQIVLTGM